MRVCDYVNIVSEKFSAEPLSYGHGTDNAHDEATFLVYAKLKLDFNTKECACRIVSEIEIDQIDTLVQIRIKDRVPVA